MPITARDIWLARLDEETARYATANDAVSFACANGVFGGFGLDAGSPEWDDERLVVVADNGWVARYDGDNGWI